MTVAPPMDQALSHGLALLRKAAEASPRAAREEVRQVLDSNELDKRVVAIIDDRFRRKYYRKIIFGAGALLIIFALGFLGITSAIGLRCMHGGSYGVRTVALAGGGTTTQYGCFGTDRPAPPPTRR